MSKVIFVIMFCFLLLNINAHAARSDKIGIIDFQQILNNSIEGKAIQREIIQKRDELKSELDKAQAEIKTLQEQYKNEALILNKEERQSREKEFRMKLNDFRKLQLNNQKEFNDFRVNLINELKKDIVDYAEKKGTKEGYRLIIEKQSGEVLYSHRSLNITDDIIQEYNASKGEKK